MILALEKLFNLDSYSDKPPLVNPCKCECHKDENEICSTCALKHIFNRKRVRLPSNRSVEK